MMKQELFSKLIVEFLERDFPEFIPSIKYHDDDSFECELRSPSDKFSVWLTTYSREITIGMEDPDGLTDIHTHISCNEPEDLEECLATLGEMINDIKNDRVVLYLTDKGVYDWIKSEDLKEKEIKKGKEIQKCFWNEQY